MKRTPMKPRSAPMVRNKTLISGAVQGGISGGGKVPQMRPEAVARRRARDTGPDARTRELVLERDGYACVCCGRSIIGQQYSIQHRKRRSQGGTNSPSNLITLLGTGITRCHGRIDSRIDPHDEAKGYTVRGGFDPAQIPVKLFSRHGSGITAWLAADGTYKFDGPDVTA
jgi:hypothetical protein